MNIPVSEGQTQDSTAPATGADRAPAEEAPPQTGFHPEAIEQAPLSNVKTPDEILAPPPPEGPSKWDVFVAKLSLAAIDSPTATLGRQFMEPTAPSAVAMAKGGDVPDYFTPAKPKLSPEEANKLYPGMPKPFDEPVDPDAAARVANLEKRRQDLRAIIAQGPAIGKGLDALVGAAAGATAGLLGGVPGVVGGAIAGGAFGAYGGAESVIVGMADPINIALMTATGGLGEGGILWKNLATNALSQGLTIPQRLKERQDVNLADELKNAVGGALGGTAVHVAAGLLTGRYGRPRAQSQAEATARQADPGTQQKMLETAVAQHEAGVNVDMGPATFEMQRRASGETEGTPPVYEFKNIAHPSERTQYEARSADHGVPIELGDYGLGIYTTDNGQAASNIVAAPDSPFTGSVHEVEVSPEAKVLDLEEPLPKPFVTQTLSELQKQGIDESLVSRAQVEAMPAKDVLEMLRGLPTNPGEPHPLDVLQERIKAEGYDGMKWVHQDLGAQQNRTVIFDPKNVKYGEEFKANKQSAPRMSAENAKSAAEAMDDPKNARDYTPDTEKKIAQDQAQAPAASNPDEHIVQVNESTAAHIKWLKEMAAIDPSLKEDPAFKALLHDEAQAKQESQAMTDLADCMLTEST